MTEADDREALVKIARGAIVAQVTGARAGIDVISVRDELGRRRGGVFVTVYCRGELRGCIGHIGDETPLVQAVADCARSAASADPRFPPIGTDELDVIALELSLLGAFEAVSGPSDIEVGRHGLLVEHKGRRGLLLPQVATEWAWGAEMFLAQTCQKAGLPLDAWKNGAALWRFEAEVFG
jgi:AmmeMemoRadiSam system protein A